MAACTVYIPTFFPPFRARYDNGEDREALNRELLKMDWITTDLRLEVIALFPTRDEKDPASGKRDHDAFVTKAKILFPQGRLFASFKQLDQVSKLFLEAWAVCKVHGQRKIYCAHGVSRGKKPKLHHDTSLQRKRGVSEKEKCKCPFEIRYSPQGKRKGDTTPDIFFRVKLTGCTYEHNCSMDTASHRLAFQANGHNTADLSRMNHVLRMLRDKPSVPNHVIRPEIAHAIPPYRGMDASFMRNFRLRVLAYILKNPVIDVSLEDVASFTSNRVIAANEIINLDQPITRQNYTSMLRRCMQEGSSTWIALKFLDELKLTLPGFDYRLKRTDDGYPEGLVWMTPEMRKNLLRYGRVLFLDGQKRQYNSMNWPYIGPALKDNEMKVCLGAESIVVEESLKMYKWVLESMCDMEPFFDLAQIRIIFGDQLVTNGLLVSLGIEETCTLRPDFYHLTNEVWPKAENFGNVLYPRIKNFLETMLKSTTESEYTNAFEGALAIVRYDPTKRSYLESIYENYQYYAGYFLSGIQGNLGLLGSVPAEQNHASIVAHLGDGASWDIATQIQQLMNRQKELTKQRTEKENSLYCSSLHYKSSKNGQSARDDQEAKKILSNYAYQKIFLKSFQGARRLRHKYDSSGNCYVWPTKYGMRTIYGMEGSPNNFESEEFINPELIVGCYGLYIIPCNGRCPCKDQVDFMGQCAHEYHVDGKFLRELYCGDQWFSRRTYDQWISTFDRNDGTIANQGGSQEYVDLETQIPLLDNQLPLPVQETEDLDASVEDDGGGNINYGDSMIGGGNITDGDSMVDSEGGNLEDMVDVRHTYSSVKRQCDELCRFVANDRKQLESVFSTVSEMLDRLRRGSNISVYFLEDPNPSAIRQSAQSGGCLLGMSRPIANAYSMKRLRTGREIRMTNGRGVQTNYKETGTATAFGASDENHLRAPKTNSRTCSMCHMKGHFIGTCPVLNFYGGAPLEKGNMPCRQQLQANISGVGTISTMRRELGRELFDTLPGDIGALVLHQRYYICDLVESPDFNGNFCIECTIVTKAGQEHPDYTKVLFSTGCVTTFLVRSKTNIIINLLKATTGTVLSQVVQNQQSQTGFSSQLMTNDRLP
jgi:hypothetical protein